MIKFLSLAICKISAKSIALSVLILLLGTQQAMANKGPQRILFTGNSFSFYNNGIHNHLGGLVRSAGQWEVGKSRFRLMTLSGGHIYEQLPLLEAMLSQKNAKWDAVVLQGHSNEPITSKKQENFKQSLGNAINMLKQEKILPVLFMTWEYEGDAEMGEKLALAYIDAAKKHQVPLVPVGLAFANAQQQHPYISLYVADVLGAKSIDNLPTLTYKKSIKHPSQSGTYLAACVFYAALYNQSPQGLPFIGGLPPEHAAELQKIAWQTVKDFIK
ncbi:MAG: hypothetical protein ACJAVV_000698 [Alphaproteobacteria bacterium]|jgi:hypothetical protein